MPRQFFSSREEATIHPLARSLHKAIDDVLAQYPDALFDPIWASPLEDVLPTFASLGHPVWEEIAPRLDQEHDLVIPGFSRSEFKQPTEMDVGFLRLIYRTRQLAGVPMRVISDARDPDGETGADKSAHKKRPCRAADFQVKNNFERARIVVAATLVGFRRLGVYPAKSGGAGSVHLDAETDKENPTPRIWTRY